jgi:hypothetical protein
MSLPLPPETKKDSALVMTFMAHLITGGVLFLFSWWRIYVD